MSLRVVTPGARTTVQDLGRAGRGAEGVPPGGAFDRLALRAANLLAGNVAGAAALEIVLVGPELEVLDDCIVAVAGSRFDVALDDEPVAPGSAFRARAGQRVTVGRAREGARCYLAIRGGIDVAPVLGSRATSLASELGPPPLSAHATLPVGRADPSAPLRVLKSDALPRFDGALRALPGPQEFTAGAMHEFFTASFVVSAHADRTGVRLEGARIDGGREIAPEGTPPGAVQVPPDGMPIALGPDRPITGGYAKIACVIGADLGLLAHARPGDTLRFDRSTVEEARAAWHARERALAEGIEEIA